MRQLGASITGEIVALPELQLVTLVTLDALVNGVAGGLGLALVRHPRV